MATNHMEEVAKILGVELDEEFEIVFSQPSNCKAIAKITQNGVNVVETNIFDAYNFKAYLLKDLLVGSYAIKRKPWKPQYGDYYWAVSANPMDSFCYIKWEGTISDYSNYKLGNCYKTMSEAKENKNKWVSFYESDEVLKV